ncbi:type II toxin-antitoxin system RelE family toxin [Paenibacillus medicaginis]|uniref:Type II toxin-antitoxin system RelE/ParE family toxin n=1 Tax=Paenibacillus medicaginis TaxID=1470560 RepID=A0ABV5C061_9BACL
MEERFDVRLHEAAEKEYNRLDGSVLEEVNNAIDELIYRADEVGKKLSNHAQTKLAGCKEIKLRSAGIRIVFRVTNEIVDVLRIVHVLTIEKRTRDLAFTLAHKRLNTVRSIPKDQMRKYLEKLEQWKTRSR